MQLLDKSLPKRKVLSLKLEDKKPKEPTFIAREHCYFMVHRIGGDMPKRIYGPDEMTLAVNHACELSARTGFEFHVMRSWRGFAPDTIA